MSVHLIRASATQIPLPDESVQCVVTSPPYWGLRKYAGEQELIWHVAYGGGEYDALAKKRTTKVQRNLIGMF